MTDTDVLEYVEVIKPTTAQKIAGLHDRKTEAAIVTGIDKANIKTVSLQLETLRKNGILVVLQISGSSMFTTAGSWLDFGIYPEGTDIRLQRLTRGRKHLIPEGEIKRLHSVETSMRNTLAQFSHKITGFQPYRWIPFTAYKTWRERWDSLLIQFESVKQDILSNYDEYVAILKKDFEQIAVSSWEAVKNEDDLIFLQDTVYTRQEFIDLIINNALAKLPAKDTVEMTIKADYITAMVYGVEDLEAENARAEQIRLNTQAEEHRIQHERIMQTLEEQEKQTRLNAMWEAEMEHARNQLSCIVSPFEEIFTTMRQQFAKDAEEMLVSIRKNGFVRGKIAEKGRGLLEMFDMFAIHDDRELRARLDMLKHAIGESNKDRGDDEPERSTEEITDILQQISDLSHKAALDMKAGPSPFAFVE